MNHFFCYGAKIVGNSLALPVMIIFEARHAYYAINAGRSHPSLTKLEGPPR